jgi:hypothetical protein
VSKQLFISASRVWSQTENTVDVAVLTGMDNPAAAGARKTRREIEWFRSCIHAVNHSMALSVSVKKFFHSGVQRRMISRTDPLSEALDQVTIISSNIPFVSTASTRWKGHEAGKSVTIPKGLRVGRISVAIRQRRIKQF